MRNIEFYIIKQGLRYLHKSIKNISCNVYAIVLLWFNSMYLQFTYLCCNFKFRRTPFVTVMVCSVQAPQFRLEIRRVWHILQADACCFL